MDFLERIKGRAAQRARGEYRGYEHVRRGIAFLQGDQSIANQAGAAFRSDLNNELQALVTLSSGTTAPSTTYAYQLWADTTANVLKRRNAANSGWLVVRSLDETFVLSRSSNTILANSDIGKTLLLTGPFTQTLTAAATLGDGWWVAYKVVGGGSITWDPNASETIEGQTTSASAIGESGYIFCNGTSFQKVAMSRYKGAIGVGRNIAARTDNATPNSKVNVTADELQLKDSSGNALVVTSVNLTAIDITASGANGLDTGAEASSTWYYVWVIAKEDGTVAGLLSISSTAPTMPAGYTYTALASAVRNDGSSNFLRYRQNGKLVVYEAHQGVLTGGSAAVETSISTASVVPPIALHAYMELSMSSFNPGGGVGSTVEWRYISAATFIVAEQDADATVSRFSTLTAFVPNVSQTMYYIWTAATAATRLANALALGFTLPMGGE